ncbi:Riboflavin transporter [Rhodobacteraceae bacterium THAF1]|uniref:DMT family transporter n=1 Tax=Palleronia sp. THAF1 TaxID=2587842 RepID=UPI000F3F0479|nr:DMT family transporter [Palleronia sp. THAF1]QFU07298.1 Riboflavin transporter [Palleronia sp. THAF1]VDC20790.1 Riboflavin transporter [Rhodobacteraceae bacterium THAF1]
MASYRGILLITLGFSVLTFMSAFVKAAGETVPTGQIVFFRAALSLPVIGAWLWARHDVAAGLHVENWRGHAVRAIVGTTSMGMGFASITLLPLAEVQAIRFATPIFLVIFAAIFLGERFRLVRLVAVLIGLAGVIVIVSPRFGVTDWGGPASIGAALALASAAMAAGAQVLIKAMSGTERSEAIAFYFLATAAVVSLITVPFGWVWPTPFAWAMLILCGLVGGVGQLLLTMSYKYAEASTLAPFSYVSMLWAVAIGFVFFSEIPTWATVAGAALIIASGVLIVLRERQLKKQETARRKLRAKGLY